MGILVRSRSKPHPSSPLRTNFNVIKLETGSTLQALYLEDPHPDKVNLLQGAYEADVGRPFVPQSVILVNLTQHVPFMEPRF